MYTIYMHRNKINGKIYIGQTCQKPSYRWKRNGKGYETCEIMWKAIQKYGWNNFEHIILKSNLTLEEANFYEEYYIKKFNSTNKQFGYNIRKGGKNTPLSEETKQKLRNKKTFLGRHHTEETIKKQKETLNKINHQSGEKNSQFGTCWIYNNKESKKIKKEELCFYIKHGWNKGRKMKF